MQILRFFLFFSLFSRVVVATTVTWWRTLQPQQIPRLDVLRITLTRVPREVELIQFIIIWAVRVVYCQKWRSIVWRLQLNGIKERISKRQVLWHVLYWSDCTHKWNVGILSIIVHTSVMLQYNKLGCPGHTWTNCCPNYHFECFIKTVWNAYKWI